jgi:hypothetical protein
MPPLERLEILEDKAEKLRLQLNTLIQNFNEENNVITIIETKYGEITGLPMTIDIANLQD